MDNSNVSVLRTRPGRALYVQPGGTLYVSAHLRIHRSDDDGRTWAPAVSLPCSVSGRLVEASRLACRLTRHEVRALAALSDGTCVAADRHWVFYARRGDPRAAPCRIPTDRVPLMPPLCLTVGPQDQLLWGEYGCYKYRRPIRIYVSDDQGRSFELAHVFEPDTIYHVHNLVYDKDLRKYWLLAGDLRHHPGIGLFSEDLNDFEWVVRGKQIHRAVCVFDFGDCLVYGTDTEMEPNAVLRLDKNSGRIERVTELDGSCIYACRFGGLYVMSTTVEPSKVNRSRNASLWVSRDGERWTRVFQAAKDRWNERYFQFGSLVLPRGESDREVIAFSGQAVRGLDGSVVMATLADSAL